MKKYLVEFIGTFFLVLCIGLAVKSGSSLTPLMIGLVLAVLIYAGGHISGGHYNPAITLSLAVSGKFPWTQTVPYRISQLLGAIIGGLCVPGLMGTHLPLVPLDAGMTRIVIGEFLFTFLLAYVVHHVTVSNPGNQFYGVAIGLTVAVAVFSIGSISGGIINPAVNIGSIFYGLFEWKTLTWYMITQFAGACFAGLVYNAVTEKD